MKFLKNVKFRIKVNVYPRKFSYDISVENNKQGNSEDLHAAISRIVVTCIWIYIFT